MSLVTILSAALIGVGAIFLGFAFLASLVIRKRVPMELRFRWTAATVFTLFFILGYTGAIAVLLAGISIPLEILTGVVFFGGALYVLLVVQLSQLTIIKTAALMEELQGKKTQVEESNRQHERIVLEIREFSKVVDRVSQGELETKIPSIKTDSELGNLSSSFERMLASIKITLQSQENSGEESGKAH